MRWSLPLAPRSIAFSPDGKSLAGAARMAAFVVWTRTKAEEEHRFGTLGCQAAGFSRDGNLLAVASQDKEGCIRCGAWPAG